MDYKNMFSALLGFSTVIFLNMPQSDTLTRGGNNVYVPLFVIVLVSQIVLEILAKYQGKLCETIEGLFTALIAVLAYALYAAASRGSGYGYNSTTYNTMPAGQYGGGSRQSGGYVNVRESLMAGVVVAIFIFIWKKWLKPKLGITFSMCPEGTGNVQQQVVQQPIQQPTSPVQQPEQPQQVDSFRSY
jgi:hypothetical protein